MLDAIRQRCLTYWPGIAIVVIVSSAAASLADHYQFPVMLLALLLGMALNFLSVDGRCKAGIEMTARQVLRWGVALLGLKITGTQIMGLGWFSILMVVLAVGLTIMVSIGLARLMGFKAFFGLLSGGSVAICGASAALAIAAAFPNHPQKDRATLFVVIGVSTLSTLAMVLYPVMAQGLGLSASDAGMFLGGTIHDVAQVVGAGYSMGPAVGDTATVVKLIRVATLVPVIVLAGWITRRFYNSPAAARGEESSSTNRTPLLPWFAVVFAGLIAANSLLPVPHAFLEIGQNASKAFLIAAMVAIGMKTHLRDVVSVGWKPIALMLIETIFIGALVIGMLSLKPMLSI